MYKLLFGDFIKKLTFFVIFFFPIFPFTHKQIPFFYYQFFLRHQFDGLPLYYWNEDVVNFGDYLSVELVKRIVGKPINVCPKDFLPHEKKLLAVGSILSFARNYDVVWGSGINGKCLDLKHYQFHTLDVRAVRGPLTRQYLMKNFKIKCPQIYGDPALLIPYFFPEFKRQKNPAYDFIIIPHYSELNFFPKEKYENVVYPTEPWDQVIQKILDSKFVISSSLHGIIIAEAYGIPACFLKITDNEPLFKYEDYYLGTGRKKFKVARSVEEALYLGGEVPVKCNLKKLYEAFPFDYWSNNEFHAPNFNIKTEDYESKFEC